MKMLLIEDDQTIASLVKQSFEDLNYQVQHFSNAEEGLIYFLNNKCNIVILDIMLPGMDGIQLLKKIREGNSACPVIILSAKQSINDKVEGFKLGADDYLVKPFAISELEMRVSALLRRTTQAIEVTSKLSFDDLKLDLDKKIAFRNDREIILHPKELALLELLLRNPEKVITKDIILEKVWGYDFDPQTNVVDVLVCRLRNKLEKENESKLLHTHRGLGYVIKKN